MVITRQSMLTGKMHTMDLPITESQLQQWRQTDIQEAMPHLTSDEREFLLSGITKDEWDELLESEE